MKVEMKQLAVLSGKGGTGKTTVASSFIRLAENRAFADCDVEAPNLHQIFLRDETPEKRPYYGLKKAVIDENICNGCGRCETLCKFGAIRKGKVNLYECEGCGVCEAVCPVRDETGRPAVRLEERVSGSTMLYHTRSGTFSTSELKIGSGASGRLVSQVRANLYRAAEKEELIILDGSPGIGCPVIASVTGVEMVLVVAEPTLSGIHDMERILETVRRFGAKTAVCINKYDISADNTVRIEKFCETSAVPLVGKIPYDKTVIQAVNSGKAVVDFPDSRAGKEIREIWRKVFHMLTHVQNKREGD